LSNWTLRMNFEKNSQLKYRLVNQTTQRQLAPNPQGDPMQQSLELEINQRVLLVEADGSAHVTSVSVPQVPGGEQHASVVYQHMTNRGGILLSSNAQQTNAFSFPEEEVSVGSSWTGVSDTFIPGSHQPVQIEYSYRVVGQENGDHGTVLTIEFASKEVEFQVPLPDGSGLSNIATQSEGVVRFGVDQGCLFSLSVKTRTVPTMGNMVLEVVNAVEQTLL
jgi:hypothetical protein